MDFEISEIKSDAILNPYFSDQHMDYLYKAQIEVKDKNFGGIFIVKKIGPKEHRIVFTTEMGNKLFDFSFVGDNFKVNYILNELDKNILINLLKNDFKVLIEENPLPKASYENNNYNIIETKINSKDCFYFMLHDNLEKIVKVKHGKENVIFTFSEINNSMAKNIQILHTQINLKIILTKI